MLTRFKVLPICLTLLLGSMHVLGQGSTPGRSSDPGSGQKSGPKTRSPKPPPKGSRNPPSPPKTHYGALNLVVSEPGSEIFLTGGKPYVSRTFVFPTDGSPLRLTDLPVGKYDLVVRKSGFHDERRQLTIGGRTLSSQSIKLRPSTAFLSVTVNIADAEVEIENGGIYSGGLDRMRVAPGIYRVHARKAGYISEVKDVKVANFGDTVSVSFALKPFPVDSVNAEAAAKLASGDYQRARELSDQVLAALPDNGKANLIRGTAEYFLGAGGALYLINAMKSGETVRLPVRLYNKESGKIQLVAGDLIVEYHRILFRSSTHAKLNFSILKHEINDIGTYNAGNITYLGMKGRGDFNGKRDQKKIAIYSHTALVSANRKETFCARCADFTCPCVTDTAALYKIILEWKANL